MTSALLFLFCTVLQLQAQEPEKLVRMAGPAVDSIPGGPPSVLIREVTAEEAAGREKRSAFDVDLVKASAYLNLAVRHAVSNRVVVGVEGQSWPGFMRILNPDDVPLNRAEDDGKGWGVSLNGQYFFDAKRRKGFNLAGGLHYYSVLHEAEYQEVASMTADIGFRIFIGATYTDIKLGIEYFPMPLRGSDGDSEGVRFISMIDNSDLFPHLSVRHGLLW